MCNDLHKKREYEAHIKSIHAAVRENFSCPDCEKVFTYKSALTRHSNLHARKPQFIFKVCKKTFYRKDSHKRHAETHANEEEGQEGGDAEGLDGGDAEGQEGGGGDDEDDPCDLEETDVKGSLIKRVIPTLGERDLFKVLEKYRNEIDEILKRKLRVKKSLKWYISVKAKYMRHKDEQI